MSLASILEGITARNSWYEKVFDRKIVSKWKSEFITDCKATKSEISELELKFKLSYFWAALGYLRATSQGSKQFVRCDWDDSDPYCESCTKIFKEQIVEDEDFKSERKKREFIKTMDDDLGWTEKFMDADFNCSHPLCDCIPPDHNIHNYVNYHRKNLLSDKLRKGLKKVISLMTEQETVDWHPGSNAQVHDIIHPSLYCYVSGKTRHTNGNVSPKVAEEFRYQWLPSEFRISSKGRASLSSYINNLKADKYPAFQPLIEETLSNFIPELEVILKRDIKDTSLQVIVKVASIYLSSKNPDYKGGSWHIEGMPYEYIAATCIHYLSVEDITDSYLEFRKPVYINEQSLEYPQGDGKYIGHHYGTDFNPPMLRLDIKSDVEDDKEEDDGSDYDIGALQGGKMNRYLGLIKCCEGASVIFPNTIQHRVCPFSLKRGSKKSLRTIIALFVIDPKHKITSTQDVPPQQGVISLEKAHKYRDKLMHHRKYYVNQTNKELFERPFSFCEH